MCVCVCVCVCVLACVSTQGTYLLTPGPMLVWQLGRRRWPPLSQLGQAPETARVEQRQPQPPPYYQEDAGSFACGWMLKGKAPTMVNSELVLPDNN